MFDIIHHPLIIKVLEIVGKERAFHNVMSDIHDKSKCSIAFNGEKFESVSLNPRTRQGFPQPPLLFNRLFNVFAKIWRHENEIRSMKIGKEVKVFLFANDMIYKWEIKKSLQKAPRNYQ